MEQSQPQKAVVFDLENTAYHGRRRTFEIVAETVKSEGIKLSDSLFSRYCVQKGIRNGMAAMIREQGKGKGDADKLAASVAERLRTTLTEDPGKPDAGLVKLLAKAAGQGLRIGALSFLERADAEALAGKLTPEDAAPEVLVAAADVDVHAKAEPWVRLAAQLGAELPACLSVTSDGRTFRATLAAGMSGVVVHDSWTEFQDYSGADLVCDKLDDSVVSFVLERLEVA